MLALVGYYQWAGRRFFAHFSPEIDIAEITRENIEEWRDESLKKGQGLASATVCATLMKVTTVFNFAVRRGWLGKSPLLGVSKGTTRNPSKDRFISLDEIEVIMQACPNQTWRVIIALLRFGGLRPSEVTLLRWSDIHETTFLVTSPKTAHHNGGGSRRCAIFPEISRELDALYIECGRGGDDFVIDQTKYHVIGLSTLSAKLIRKAGLPAIPRFADNCRHSRSIELRNDPNVGPWLSSKMLGHTLKIADGCYSGVRDEDFKRVSQKVTLAERKTTRYASPSSKTEPAGVQTADMEP